MSGETEEMRREWAKRERDAGVELSSTETLSARRDRAFAELKRASENYAAVEREASARRLEQRPEGHVVCESQPTPEMRKEWAKREREIVGNSDKNPSAI